MTVDAPNAAALTSFSTEVGTPVAPLQALGDGDRLGPDPDVDRVADRARSTARPSRAGRRRRPRRRRPACRRPRRGVRGPPPPTRPPRRRARASVATRARPTSAPRASTATARVFVPPMSRPAARPARNGCAVTPAPAAPQSARDRPEAGSKRWSCAVSTVSLTVSPASMRLRGERRATSMADPGASSASSTDVPSCTVVASMAVCTSSSAPRASTSSTRSSITRSGGAPASREASSRASGRMPSTTSRPTQLRISGALGGEALVERQAGAVRRPRSCVPRRPHSRAR